MKISSIQQNLKKKKIWYFSAGLSAIIILVFALVMKGSSSEDLRWAMVQRGNFIVDLVESGEIRAVNTVVIKAPMEWRMELQIIDLAPEGTIVKKGDMLVQFDTSKLEEELKTAQESLDNELTQYEGTLSEQATRMSQLETDLKMAEFSRELAELELQNIRYESDVRKEEARLKHKQEELKFEEVKKKIESQIIIDSVSLNRADMRLDYAKKRVRDIEKKIKSLTMYASVSGMVVYNEIGGWNSRYKVGIGEKPRPGQPVVNIPDLDNMEMVAWVNEIDVEHVSIGDRVILRLDAFEETVFNGSVTHVNQIGRDKNFQVNIKIEGSDENLKPGMTVQGRILIKEVQDALYIPTGTVFEYDGKSIVFTRQSYPDPVPVELGERNDNFIIVEKGVKEDDKVAWVPPPIEVYPLGTFAEMERRKIEKEEILDLINKNKSETAKKDSTQKADTEDEQKTSVTGSTKSIVEPGNKPDAMIITTTPGEANIKIMRK